MPLDLCFAFIVYGGGVPQKFVKPHRDSRAFFLILSLAQHPEEHTSFEKTLVGCCTSLNERMKEAEAEDHLPERLLWVLGFWILGWGV